MCPTFFEIFRFFYRLGGILGVGFWVSDFGCFDVVFDNVELLMEFVWMVMGHLEVKLFHWQK